MVEVKVRVPDKLVLREMASGFDEAVEDGLDEVANLASRAKDRRISRTYERAIPRGKNGRPRYKRTGAFRRNQRVVSARGRRTLTPTGKVLKYEPRLANLNAGPDGINRTNAAGPDTAVAIEPQVPRVMEQAIQNKLRL